MGALQIVQEAGPAAQIATPTSTVTINYAHVEDANKAADIAFDLAKDIEGADPVAVAQALRQLSLAVSFLVDLNVELVRGLNHEHIHVANYPNAEVYEEAQRKLR